MATRVVVRKSGGSTIVSLPKTVLEMLHVHAGTILILSVENKKIVLTPTQDAPSLDALLAGCNRKKFALTDEDKTWTRSKSKGKEF